MREVEVQFHPRIDGQLAQIEHRIANYAGAEIAARYVDELFAYCLEQGIFPDRGERWSVDGYEYRIVFYQKRYRVIYDLRPQFVYIVGIFHSRQSDHSMARELQEYLA